MNGYRRDTLLDAGQQRNGVIELFLDNHRLSWQQNVERRLRRPDQASNGPVMPQEHPWEVTSVGNFSSALWSEDKSFIRLWYCAVGSASQSKANHISLAYAESGDGLKWEKPMMEHVAFGDTRATNLVLGPQTNPHGTCILLNQHNDDPKEKYLAYFDSYPAQRQNAPSHPSRGTYTVTSPDGLHWTPTLGTPAISSKSDTQQSVVWMPNHGQYTAFMRGTTSVNEPFKRFEQQRIRYVRSAWSDDFVNWSPMIELLRADEQDGNPDTQFHEFSVTKRGDQYIALVGMMRISQLLPSKTYITLEEATCDVQLMSSRDGTNWHRVADRQVFMPVDQPGPADYDHRHATTQNPLARNGELDESGLYTKGARSKVKIGNITRPVVYHMLGANLLFDDEKVYIFHGATNRWRKEGHSYCLHLSTLPRDRFQAIKPRRLAQPGIVETKPLYFRSDGDLVVNADASLGQLTVELTDFHGQVIPGFEESHSIAMTTDSYDHPMRWQSPSGTVGLNDASTQLKADPVSGAYPAIRVRFYLRQAWLYAVQWPLDEVALR